MSNTQVRESPFCHGDENMDTMEDDAEVALYFALEDGVAVIDLRAWGMWLAVKADSNAQSPLTLCKDGQCSQPFCVWDSQCPEGYHCCKTTFEFTCQKQYRPQPKRTVCLLRCLKSFCDSRDK